MRANSQSRINGKLIDNHTRQNLQNVKIVNENSRDSVFSDSIGNFSIMVKSGELITITQEGYDITRIRIINEKSPTYYKLHLDKTIPRLDVRGHLLPYQKDSIEYYELYATTLNGSKKGENNASGLGNVSLDALSKQNRDRWAFQGMFAKWQNDKYIDFVFNKELVQKITYLKGEDLRRFMDYYRPSYTFLRSATEYEYLNYIKQSYKQFQKQGKY